MRLKETDKWPVLCDKKELLFLLAYCVQRVLLLFVVRFYQAMFISFADILDYRRSVPRNRHFPRSEVRTLSGLIFHSS